jgi:GTP-binding protein LepA
VIGIDASDAIPCSAKTGMGIDEILEAIVAKVPPPKGNPMARCGHDHRQLVRPYVGVVMLVRVVDGELKKGERFKMMATGCLQADNIGVFTPANQPRDALRPARWASSSPASRN